MMTKVYDNWHHEDANKKQISVLVIDEELEALSNETAKLTEPEQQKEIVEDALL